MQQEFMDIEKEEAQCEEMVGRELADALGINLKTFDVLASLFGEISGKVQDIDLEDHQYVHMKLGAKMLSDLRTIKLLTCKGYTPQAAVVASTLLEESLNMLYIGSNNCRAKEWLKHSDESKSVWKVRFLLDELKEKIGNGVRPVWRRLCQIKHYNPLLGPAFHVKIEYKRIKFHPGPHLDRGDNIWKEFILIYSSVLIVDALKEVYQSFMKYHSSRKSWQDQFKALELEIREFLLRKDKNFKMSHLRSR